MPRIAIEGHEDWERVKSNITESMMTILNEKLKSTTSPEVKEALKAHLLQVPQTRIVFHSI
jgi:5S rRNA maturation endonuclease (ribonuclease M5)